MFSVRRRAKGFTLAELLIALAILGVIATFTIPKVLNAGTSGQNTAIAKEMASMVSGAFSAYQLESTVTSGSTDFADLTEFINYVKIETSGGAGDFISSGTACAAATPCLILHSGGVIQYSTAQNFAGTSATHYIFVHADPDGAGAQDEASFVQYANGRLTTGEVETAEGNTAPNSPTLTLQATDPAYIENWE